MKYSIIFDPGAAREFGKLPKSEQKRLRDLIDGLSKNPRPAGYKKLSGVDAYKIRAGDYRVIYAIKDSLLIVLVLKVGNRREIYKDIASIKKRLKK